jgi:hypothetical protein
MELVCYVWLTYKPQTGSQVGRGGGQFRGSGSCPFVPPAYLLYLQQREGYDGGFTSSRSKQISDNSTLNPALCLFRKPDTILRTCTT